uniref:E3 ubiquitin-protein ligase n=1 Tax=Timema cristinae TaxID=61476 RepID=A0A7R9GY40_TIMCR|nr:unnamed protein product [Timema cristinae]
MVLKEIQKHYECPICFEYILTPILQCTNGHLVCGDCRFTNGHCALCMGPNAIIRNFEMENLARIISFPCKYKSIGCEVSVLHKDLFSHHDMCEFKSYSCPCIRDFCGWQGPLGQVAHHLNSAHVAIVTLQGETISFTSKEVSLPSGVDYMIMQSCFSRYFLIYILKIQLIEEYTQYFGFVQLIGSWRDANQFEYNLEFRGPTFTLKWKNVTSSINQNLTHEFLTTQCLVFGPSSIPLSDDNDSLVMNVTISRVTTADKVEKTKLFTLQLLICDANLYPHYFRKSMRAQAAHACGTFLSHRSTPKTSEQFQPSLYSCHQFAPDLVNMETEQTNKAHLKKHIGHKVKPFLYLHRRKIAPVSFSGSPCERIAQIGQEPALSDGLKVHDTFVLSNLT